MLSISGILGFMLLVMVVGKNKKQIRPISYSLIIIIAVIQSLIVLSDMMAMLDPSIILKP